ncbi:Gfo/Idh/MocA family protein [Parasulfitobacter algicola]|uniref:Gfo/Idh/MocA family oxidoreductase n=1 Tax=Parasulfitobacter algicola TaxID=2614809 RepID=A0ABX2IR94_9RHOB|nr:Gfo/Idh/MocA family oxidoreductase [Sulfitobacter algicola]NSX55399.1 Gfo/Idh/MocA family oxidoreductase [Sulfitobacter algicola]
MRPLKLGMVGGGQGAFIGGVHRMAARLDGHWQLVAGAFSSDAVRAHASAAELGIDLDRSYGSFTDMAAQEAAHPDRIDAVAIVTPNHMHAPAAIAFLEAGIPVICDKPLTATMDQAHALAQTVRDTGTPFFLTHNYTGYPLIREARAMVARGDLGKIRVIQAEYAQGWLAQPLEGEGQKQAAWRTDPDKSGAGGAIGDIGTHALNLLSFVTGEVPAHLSADLQSFVSGRKLDDNAHITLRFDSGARGMIWASQVAVGCENGLRLRIYGDEAGLEWSQEDPNRMKLTSLNAPARWLTRAGAGTSDLATRIPAGHPEGYLEAFATLYAEIARALRGENEAAELVPGLNAGLEGMAFISACVASSSTGGKWVSLD